MLYAEFKTYDVIRTLHNHKVSFKFGGKLKAGTLGLFITQFNYIWQMVNVSAQRTKYSLFLV